MSEGLAHESKRLDVREKKAEKQWRGTGNEILQLVTTATGKLQIGEWDVWVCVWACGSISVADKWPNTTCGERSILTIISSSFPFISSDWSVAPVLHHNKLQHSNTLIVKPPDHNTDTHTHQTLINTSHPFPLRQNGAGDELKFNNFQTLWKSTPR